MSNTYFRFKQFTIHQANTSMKVGTDGVLLGAWVNVLGKAKILDVGTGTGIIALMLAQRNTATNITAIEVDESSYKQSLENILSSPYKSRIKVLNASFQEFSISQKFDLVISNPPFFKATYLSGNDSRDVARQRINFDMNEFFEFAFNISNEEGEVAIIYPFEQLEYITKIAVSKGFFINLQCLVKGNQNKPFKRVLLQFSKQETNVETSELCIEDERHQYTDEFTKLVKDFYLNL